MWFRRRFWPTIPKRPTTNKLKSQPLPPSWREDNLSDYLHACFANNLATFHYKKAWFQKLLDIDTIYKKVSDHTSAITQSDDRIVEGVLFFRSHSAFCASSFLACGGMSGEVFAINRLCLEYAGYALLMNNDSSLKDVFFKRHESEEYKRKSSRSFSVANIYSAIKTFDEKLADLYKNLYERCIDFGAHPNDRAIRLNADMRQENDVEVFRQAILNVQPDVISHVTKTTFQIGFVSLSIFQHIMPKIFEELDLDSHLQKLKHDVTTRFPS